MTEDRFPKELEALFASYKDEFAALDASRNFMPNLWARIDQRQRVTYSFRRFASGFVTIAAAIVLMLSAALWTPSELLSSPSPTYVDVLADDDAGREFDQIGSL